MLALLPPTLPGRHLAQPGLPWAEFYRTVREGLSRCGNRLNSFWHSTFPCPTRAAGRSQMQDLQMQFCY
jgi:hypothetical protein